MKCRQGRGSIPRNGNRARPLWAQPFFSSRYRPIVFISRFALDTLTDDEVDQHPWLRRYQLQFGPSKVCVHMHDFESGDG